MVHDVAVILRYTSVSSFCAEKELGREDLELQLLRENLLERELKYRNHLGLFSVIPHAADCATARLPSQRISLAQSISLTWMWPSEVPGYAVVPSGLPPGTRHGGETRLVPFEKETQQTCSDSIVLTGAVC